VTINRIEESTLSSSIPLVIGLDDEDAKQRGVGTARATEQRRRRR
jgi:hypothetical protein